MKFLTRFEQLNSELKRAKERIDLKKSQPRNLGWNWLNHAETGVCATPEADLDQLYKTLEQERVAKLNASTARKALTVKLKPKSQHVKRKTIYWNCCVGRREAVRG